MVAKNRDIFRRSLQRVETIVPGDPAEQFVAYVEQLAYRDFFQIDSNSGDKVTPNGMRISKTMFEYFTGTIIEYAHSSFGTITTTRTGPTSLGPAMPGSVDFNDDYCYNKALSSLYEQLRGSVDLSVTVAQAGEAAALWSSAKNLMRYVSSFRPRDLKRWKSAFDINAMKAGGNKWLEYSFGLKPLVQDVYGSLEQLGKLINQQDGSLLNVSGRGGRNSKFFSQETNSYGAKVTSKSQQFSLRCEVKIHCRIKPSRWSQVAQFTSLNPVSFVWELLPYSFAVDYIYDVGGYLRSMESAMVSGVEVINGYVTFGNKVSGVASIVGGNDMFHFNLNASWQTSYKNRGILNSLPIPRPPSFQADLGSGRLLNAAALLTTFLKERKSGTHMKIPL